MDRLAIIRSFYAIPRTPEAREALFAAFHPDVAYVGVGKETGRGVAAIRDMFGRYAMSRANVTGVTFDLRHMAQNGEAVLVDMVATFIIDGEPRELTFSLVFHVDDAGLITFWQEHYDLGRHAALFGPTPVPRAPSAP